MTINEASQVTVPRLEANSIAKTYGSFRALSDVSFDIRPGELHGLVGQNGSGKSTLIKVFTGYHAPDAGGQLMVDGHAVSLPITAAERHKHGISVVHQNLGLVAESSVTANVRIEHHEPSRILRRVNWRHEAARTREALQLLGSDIEPSAQVADLNAEQRATVAIARAMQDHDAGEGLIIFDESTRPLTKDALSRFYDLLGTILSTGTSVLMISHRLEEVMQHTDRVSILRDGRLVESGLPTHELTEKQMVTAMLGRELGAMTSAHHASAGVTTRPSESNKRDGAALTAVDVHGLSGDVVRDVAFSVAPGEILGVTGLIGSGFEEIPYLLAGARRAAGGTLAFDGCTTRIDRANVRAMIDTGVFLVPEERAELGLCLDISIEQNITLPRLRTKGSPLWIGRGWRSAEVDQMIKTLNIRPPDGSAIVGTLSGGNQQKVLLAKWLVAHPRLLLLHEPAQAVDVGARLDIVHATFELASRGTSVVVAATDPGDLAALCSRVIVMHDGRIVDELSGDFDQDSIIQATFAESRVPRSRGSVTAHDKSVTAVHEDEGVAR